MTKEELDQIYVALAEEVLAEKFSLRRLDERFAENALKFYPKGKKSEDRMKFFSLYNRAHTERLSDEDRVLLENWGEKNTTEEKEVEKLIDMIERTWKNVLATRYSPEEITYMHRSIPEASSLPENALVFVFSDTFPEGAADDIDWETEKQKEAVFYAVKEQYENLVNEKNDTRIYLMKG
ncbi:hypothetical protein [Oribacterium sp. FC2011]|uniref:hypothetical protein n=1 Tax=Oribacterium sp. FC2011 TaxID=1408311 RepID=UPI0004E0EE00|nr:hypothetical protein [Oribacterium sp. FC2011]